MVIKTKNRWDILGSNEQLQTIKTDLDYPEPIADETWTDAALKRLAFLDRIVKKFRKKDKNDEEASSFDRSESATTIFQGSLLAAVISAGLDFIRIPFIYLACYLLDVKIPFTLNNNLQWAYSTILFALSAVALALPVAAPLIAFILASIIFVASAYFLGQAFYESKQLKIERRDLTISFAKAEEEMSLIKAQAALLEGRLVSTYDTFKQTEVIEEIKQLNQRYETTKSLLFEIQQNLHKVAAKARPVSTLHIVDKAFAVGLACLTIVALVTSLYFPPVGAAMLLGIGVFGVSYYVARLAAPLFTSVARWILSKINPDTAAENAPSVVSRPTLGHDKNSGKIKNNSEVLSTSPESPLPSKLLPENKQNSNFNPRFFQEPSAQFNDESASKKEEQSSNISSMNNP